MHRRPQRSDAHQEIAVAAYGDDEAAAAAQRQRGADGKFRDLQPIPPPPS